MSRTIKVFIDDKTEARLQKSSQETARDITELAEAALSEYVLSIWRGRSDDPANAIEVAR